MSFSGDVCSRNPMLFSLPYEVQMRLVPLREQSPVVIHRPGGGGVGEFYLCHNKIYLILPQGSLKFLFSPPLLGSESAVSFLNPPPPFILFWWRLIPPFPLLSILPDAPQNLPPPQVIESDWSSTGYWNFKRKDMLHILITNRSR